MPLQDIAIVGFDPQFAEKLPNSRIKRVYLRLNDSPHAQWIVYFENSRRLPRHLEWPEAHVLGNFIAVDCVPSDIPRIYMKEIAEDVAEANRAYARYCTLNS